MIFLSARISDVVELLVHRDNHLVGIYTTGVVSLYVYKKGIQRLRLFQVISKHRMLLDPVYYNVELNNKMISTVVHALADYEICFDISAMTANIMARMDKQGKYFTA